MKRIIPILIITTLLSSCRNLSKLTKNKSFYEQKIVNGIRNQYSDYYELKRVFFKLDKSKEYYVFRYDMTTMRNVSYYVGKINDEEFHYVIGVVSLNGYVPPLY